MHADFCLETVRDEYGKITVQAMQEVLSYAKQDAANQSDLDTGIWYAGDYCDALHKKSQPKRITWFKDNLIFQFGYANKKCFTRKGNSWFHFIAKVHLTASEALKVAMTGFGIYDCGMVCQIARYRALELILGTDRFNRLFDSRVQNARLNIGYLEDDEMQPMRLFVDFPLKQQALQATEEGRLSELQCLEKLPVRIGQLVFIYGAPEYQMKHPHGPHQAFNLICSQESEGEQAFIGFGLDAQGVSAKKVYSALLEQHNSPQNHQRLMHDKEYNDLQKMRQAGNFTRFDTHTADTVLGFMPDGVQDFRIQLIWQLAHTPPEEIKPALAEHYATM